MQLKQLPAVAIDFAFPRHCACCGSACIDDERFVCAGCLADMPWHSNPVLADPDFFTRVVSPLRYEFPVDAMIKSLKFRRQLGLVSALRELLLAAVPHLPDDVDALLPVPLHWQRRLRRGFNQSRELGQGLCAALGVAMIRPVRRSRATGFQTGLSARERNENLRGAFRLRQTPTSKHILIVDDVMTTGSTARALAAVLLEAGVAKVSLLTLARAD